MEYLIKIVIIVIVAFILLSTGVVVTLFQSFGAVFGWFFGIIMTLLIIAMIFLAALGKR